MNEGSLKTKDSKLYYSISEASSITEIKPHVLRYWETQFKMLRPKKNKAGNRMYRKRDLKLILLLKELLYDQGFTIQGARKKLQDERDQIKDQLEIAFKEVDRAAVLMEVKRGLETLLDEMRTFRA
ncbi:MAG: MerR family transcriptional regulator [Candidatus Eisenbacteria bacterium]|uniref:MerR family transcriptional regulator n=1 Tax=Eiseniibacteriota bacterium TaxID=2212470 RepID=A0A7Y2H0X4_UNCEI|nr:MerR family transcriptional regulator [Candidatus Eisenbacteria bacterium]